MATSALPHSFMKVSGASLAASDLLRSSSNGFLSVPLKALGRSRLSVVSKRDFTVSAVGRKNKRKYDVPEDAEPFMKSVAAHYDMVKDLETEVAEEYSKAMEALGFTDRLEMLEEEIAEAKETIDPSVLENKKKLQHDIKQSLSDAPNYESLKRKLDMLKELSLKEEIMKRFKEVLYRADVKEKREALEAEIESAVDDNDEDLYWEAEGRKRKVMKEVELELMDVLRSMKQEFDIVEAKAKAKGYVRREDAKNDESDVNSK